MADDIPLLYCSSPSAIATMSRVVNVAGSSPLGTDPLDDAINPMYDKLRRSRRLDAVQSGCSALSIVKQGDLIVVANVGDSRVVLGTTFDDDAITSSNSSST
uniref:protein-serine/threonine phosphatase n=1 Tax=Zea mays TaxID=4577 RepID=A0A804MJN2_MAIZE